MGLTKEQVIEKFYNKDFEEQMTTTTINITPEIAEFFKNRYFLDTEMDDRVEALMFKKTETGIYCEYVGTDLRGVAYVTDSLVDEWQDNVDPEDTYNGHEMIYVLEKSDRFMYEITRPVYEHIKALAEKHIKDMDTNSQYVKSVLEIILNNLKK